MLKKRSFTTFFVLGTLLWAAGSSAFATGNASEVTLADIRARIRAEAGLTGDLEREAAPGGEAGATCPPPVEIDDLPMVQVMVLPGDTHHKLALELTGSPESEDILRAIAPELTPGQFFPLPNTLLIPRLADPVSVVFSLGGDVPTLASLVQNRLNVAKSDAQTVVRNLQRINSILDPGKIQAGVQIRVPSAMLKADPQLAETVLIRDDYKSSGALRNGPAKQVVSKKYSAKLKKSRNQIKTAQFRTHQTRAQTIDLVVVHTTEHSQTSFESVAAYIRRHGLANYLIGPKGEVYRIVPEEFRAYGCGESLWEGRYEVDQRAINIEIYADTAPGPKYSGIADAQYEGLKKLLADINARRPEVHQGRVVTHSMVAVSFKYGTRSRKGDPYEFNWAKLGLPDNSVRVDQDVLLGRVSLCRDKRFADRITPGQTAAVEFLNKM